jgi:hypothetical protein
MAEHDASFENPVSRTASPTTEAMELGFQANLGFLSQIGIQLFSPETAVYFATKGVGWWKARGRVESLQQFSELRVPNWPRSGHLMRKDTPVEGVNIRRMAWRDKEPGESNRMHYRLLAT